MLGRFYAQEVTIQKLYEVIETDQIYQVPLSQECISTKYCLETLSEQFSDMEEAAQPN